jgi:hypothetical protein
MSFRSIAHGNFLSVSDTQKAPLMEIQQPHQGLSRIIKGDVVVGLHLVMLHDDIGFIFSYGL